MNQHFVREKRIDITTLSNGLMVATERMPEIATATLGVWVGTGSRHEEPHEHGLSHLIEHMAFKGTARRSARQIRSEEHTSELQSRQYLVCRLLLEKKKRERKTRPS